MKSLIISLLLLPGWFAQAQGDYSKYGVPFLNAGASYAAKPDQALLQNQYPLSDAARMSIKPEDFANLTQEEIDQIYIRLTSGPIVPGQYQGSIVRNSELQRSLSKALTSFGGVDLYGTLEKLKTSVSSCKDNVSCAGEFIWSGKQIFPTNENTGVTELRNAIDPNIATAIYKLFGGTGSLSSNNRNFYGTQRTMLFPAKVYCAQSLFDHRRESIVIDYAWTKDFMQPIGTSGLSYFDEVDTMGGRGMLAIRDEIRMVRPGLYLGRAYINKIFALNFVLSKPGETNGQDSCFNGTTTR